MLDGAMGTMIQSYNLSEDNFRGNIDGNLCRLNPDIPMRGCNDLLSLTQPEVISEIHREYLNAGADIIETNSFNANAISLAEYGLSELAPEICRAAAYLARRAADEHMAATGRKVFVAGSMGPGNVSLSISRGFGSMSEAWCRQAEALIEGGVDLILLETIFDTLNAKASILGVKKAIEASGREIPIMISVTLTENGRTLSGQSLKAFIASVSHAGAISIGLNCGFGAEGMAPWLEQLQDIPYFVSLHPNAGLPDELGQYTETPEKMAATMEKFLKAGKLNIAGGCCGTSPRHISLIAEIARHSAPRTIPAQDNISSTLSLAGTEHLDINDTTGFVKVGERCNVAGSRKFLRLINEGNLSEALEIATAQIDKGARILDINMDDAMLDAPEEMERFVALLGSDSATSRLPLMIDSSDMEVIRRALRKIQGRPIVNSISLKEGEKKFIANALEIRSLGAAVVVMSFDEAGQATTFQRRIEICRRAYDILTRRCGFQPSEIIFDPNILTIATGIADHDRYAIDFLDAISWIKENLPGAKVSGGVSNLSFAFRGHNKVREAMHTVFLSHAIERGMDMAIVNPSTSTDINSVEPALREAVEDVIFCRRPDATDRLLLIATEIKKEADRIKVLKQSSGSASPAPAKKGETSLASTSIETLIIKGIDSGLEKLLHEAMAADGSAMAIVKNHLMAAMERVGDDFGAGRIFLPQVVRSASVMKRAIDYLTPAIERENSLKDNEKSAEGLDINSQSGASADKKFVLATVKGDVHDIGKNIVAVILKCSGFEVIDLGVMVECERIIRAVKDSGAKFVGLSGLITPSLTEMCEVARQLEKEGMTDVTLCVGGATTSELHTAVKIAPLFSGTTLHTRDAAQLPVIASALADPARCDSKKQEITNLQIKIREDYETRKNTPTDNSDSTSRQVETPMPAPATPGLSDLKIPVVEFADLINWRAFLHTWKLPAELASKIPNSQLPSEQLSEPESHAEAEARKLISDARELIGTLIDNGVPLDARVAILPAVSNGNEIQIKADDDKEIAIPTPRRQNPPHAAISDFIATHDDHIGIFTVTAKPAIDFFKNINPQPTEYEALLIQSLSDRLVEAATDRMHTIAAESLWGLKDSPRGIRPAVGYPSLPDHSLMFILDKILHFSELGIFLTENGALSPSSTTAGLIFPSPKARYLDVGHQL